MESHIAVSESVLNDTQKNNLEESKEEKKKKKKRNSKKEKPLKEISEE